MNCRHVLNTLSAYIDRELPGEEMLSVRSHLERCPDCLQEMESLKEIKTSLNALPMHEPRVDLASDILRQIHASEPEAPRPFAWGVMIATSVAAAALALFLFNTYFGASSQPQLADDREFDYSSDHGLRSPGIDGGAPLVPVSR